MQDVDEGLKTRVGWWACVLSGLGAAVRLGFAVQVKAGSDRLVSQHARTALVANCGQLTGGMRLAPDAAVDDGRLDVIVASPRSLPGWLAIAAHVLSGGRRGLAPLVHLQDAEVSVRAAAPVAAQLDGDAVGARTLLACRVLADGPASRLPQS